MTHFVITFISDTGCVGVCMCIRDRLLLIPLVLKFTDMCYELLSYLDYICILDKQHFFSHRLPPILIDHRSLITNNRHNQK